MYLYEKNYLMLTYLWEYEYLIDHIDRKTVRGTTVGCQEQYTVVGGIWPWVFDWPCGGSQSGCLDAGSWSKGTKPLQLGK